MKTKTITTWATKPPTARAGRDEEEGPRERRARDTDPGGGSTTGPLAFVRDRTRSGLPEESGSRWRSRMFPTFCTDTPTWRWRKVGWIDRITKVAS